MTRPAPEPQCRFCGGFRYHARDCSYAQPGTVIPKFGPETGKTTDPICDNCGSNLAMGNKYGDYHASGRCRGPNPTPPDVQTASSASAELRAANQTGPVKPIRDHIFSPLAGGPPDECWHSEPCRKPREEHE